MRDSLLGACLFLLSQQESCSSSSTLGTFWLDRRIYGIFQYHVTWKMCPDLALDFLLLDTYCLHCFPIGNAGIRRIRAKYGGAYHDNFSIAGLDLFPARGSHGREKCFFEAKISMKKWSNEN